LAPHPFPTRRSSDLLPEDVAYELTKLYVEVILPQMAEQQAYLKVYAERPELLVDPWVIPGHPGALRYYEEAGLEPRVVVIDQKRSEEHTSELQSRED